MTQDSESAAACTGEMVVSRLLDAPRELVWKAWTEPDRIKLWWGPAGWSAPSIDIDLRVGGKYLYAMRAPDGLEMWTTGVFREIEPMKRIVYTDSFADEHGNVINPTEAGASADFPLELLDIVTFEQIGGHTKVTMCANGMPASEAELARQGTEQMLEKLAAAVARSAAPAPSPDATVFTLEPGKPEIVISRFLHAPRQRVFEILTDPALVPKWWGPGWLTTRVVSMEVRPGGVWDFIQHDAEGNVYPFRGTYSVVEPPARIVRTFEYLGTPGSVALETTSLEEKDGGTLMTTKSEFQSVAARDAMVQADMEKGARESMERFVKLL